MNDAKSRHALAGRSLAPERLNQLDVAGVEFPDAIDLATGQISGAFPRMIQCRNVPHPTLRKDPRQLREVPLKKVEAMNDQGARRIGDIPGLGPKHVIKVIEAAEPPSTKSSIWSTVAIDRMRRAKAGFTITLSPPPRRMNQ